MTPQQETIEWDIHYNRGFQAYVQGVTSRVCPDHYNRFQWEAYLAGADTAREIQEEEIAAAEASCIDDYDNVHS